MPNAKPMTVASTIPTTATMIVLMKPTTKARPKLFDSLYSMTLWPIGMPAGRERKPQPDAIPARARFSIVLLARNATRATTRPSTTAWAAIPRTRGSL
jgi:hypothetical protein